ncbi:MAG: hypothetical protein UHM08_09070 [Bacteroidales bacterium]|jgi:hypothetical protein|nr:hypothetical protein [Bacteroidales bacterium]
MKPFIILSILLISLNGCAKPSASENITNSAINTAEALENSLPSNCNTKAIKSQITAIKTQITAISQSCETEKNAIKADKVKWQTAFFGLLLAVVVFILKKVLK